MHVVSHSQNLWLKWMFLYLKQRVLGLYFTVLLKVIPDCLQRMLALLYVENEIENLSKALHDFVIKNAVDWKLRSVKSRKYTPYFEVSNLWIFAFLQKQKGHFISHILWQIFCATVFYGFLNQTVHKTSWNFGWWIFKNVLDHWNQFEKEVSLLIKHKLFDPNQSQADRLNDSLMIWKKSEVFMHRYEIVFLLKNRLTFMLNDWLWMYVDVGL